MLSFRSIPALCAMLVVASPAYATGGGVPLPEPSSLFLLGMGVAGVALGRRFSRKKVED
ncbi:hypothetical protein WSK_2446 [Novosphingobium sp. Rr 2-17]|uniref:PEP-CTERM sorting domain-containing protein n=1 Tax=Novosphingobium sp. Rr 2-17 TaxID=555793 RepID=UPI000269A83A|nr:PEP-CTERM sorting domain-containing protein [Novosphingobium sp. Rr 2-17]EIZ78903.1 hypothetical protein WSK_2446 [Novosphingobium sp. Rr 2-17]